MLIPKHLSGYTIYCVMKFGEGNQCKSLFSFNTITKTLNRQGNYCSVRGSVAHLTTGRAQRTSTKLIKIIKLKSKVKVNLDICKAPFNAVAFSKALRYGNTQFYMPCLPLLPSNRASPSFGWYSFYRPTGGRLSRPAKLFQAPTSKH